MKKIYFLITLLGLNFASLQAAAPATHVYFAERWMEKNSTRENDALIAGTLFPDIRYLGTVSRNSTHEKNLTAEIIRNTSDAFKAGMRIHAYIDVEREAFIKKSRIDSKLKKIPNKVRVLFLKMLEDEILWDQIGTDAAHHLMNQIYQGEINSGIDQATIVDWHNEMMTYFKERPSRFLKKLASENKGFLQADAKTIKTWCQIFPEYAKDKTFIKYTNDMVKYVLRDF